MGTEGAGLDTLATGSGDARDVRDVREAGEDSGDEAAEAAVAAAALAAADVNASWCCFVGSGTRSFNSRTPAAAMDSAQDAAAGRIEPAEHLVVLVNGIVGSANNWRFAAEQFRERLPDKVLVHCSVCNSAFKTFNGVDVMGRRLAEEVQGVVDQTPGVRKISFVAHSLGGLVARYAVGQLVQGDGEGEGGDGSSRIAGLEAMNFVTLATPHLGSRGNGQLPFLFGVRALEALAPAMAHWFVGPTGRHLFLTDGDGGRLPLLRRMATDCQEGRFLAGLKAFKARAAYANVSFDHLVGWRTASIRRESAMPPVKQEPVSEKYPHVMRVEEAPAGGMEVTSRAVVAADLKPLLNGAKAGVEDAEEEMVSGLSQMSWRRVDISFGSFAAHNTIQVKVAARHGDGADVIAHILDNFRL